MQDVKDAQDRARDSIVFALKSWGRTEVPELPKLPRVEPRPAIKTKEQTLDVALEEMMDRFPRTLDYLAK
jgi:hypothetical protein